MANSFKMVLKKNYGRIPAGTTIIVKCTGSRPNNFDIANECVRQRLCDVHNAPSQPSDWEITKL